MSAPVFVRTRYGKALPAAEPSPPVIDACRLADEHDTVVPVAVVAPADADGVPVGDADVTVAVGDAAVGLADDAEADAVEPDGELLVVTVELPDAGELPAAVVFPVPP